jgi:hypothetical protein
MRRTFADPQTRPAAAAQEDRRHAAMAVPNRRSSASKRPASPVAGRRYVEPCSRPSSTVRVRMSGGAGR